MDKVKEIFRKILGFVTVKWNDTPVKNRIIFFSVLAVILISVIALVAMFNRKDYEVMYKARNNAELHQVTTVLSTDIGVSDFRVSGLDVLVPVTEVDYVRMQMAINGYPTNPYNNDVWNSNVDMFSTDAEKQEASKQQTQAWLQTMYEAIPEVMTAMVALNIPGTKNYVIVTNPSESSASVMLKLRPGAKLTNEQVEGVYALVAKATPNLKNENITVTDGSGNMLIPLTDEEKNNANGLQNLDYEKRRTAMQLEFRKSVTDIYNEQLKGLLDKAFKNYNVSVFVDLDYGKTRTESVNYSPSVADAGTKGGMINRQIWRQAAGGRIGEGGLVGTAPNADISGDFPSVPDITAGNDGYLDQESEVDYLVNEVRNQYESDGFNIKTITASVVVDSAAMSGAEIETWQTACANAIGGDVTRVTFQPVRFPVEIPPETVEQMLANDANRNILILVIISLATVLIILFVLAVLTSGSKKKRHVRARMAALAASNAAGTAVVPADDVFTQTRAVAMDEDEFEIPSLLDANGNEAREAVLKREIRDFAKSNPEIVAQLIRTWMKSEDD